MFLANKLVSSWKPNQFLKRIVKVSSFVFLRRVYFWIVSHNVNKTWWNSETFIRKSNLGRGQQAKYREIGANLWTLSNGFSISNIRFNQMCVSPFGGKIGFFSYLRSCHVWYWTMGLDGFELVQTPIQLFESFDRQPNVVFIWKKGKTFLWHFLVSINFYTSDFMVELGSLIMRSSTRVSAKEFEKFGFFLEEFSVLRRKINGSGAISCCNIFPRSTILNRLQHVFKVNSLFKGHFPRPVRTLDLL